MKATRRHFDSNLKIHPCNVLLAIAVLLSSTTALSQTLVSGRIEVDGNLEVNSEISHFVQIMAFDPPDRSEEHTSELQSLV